MTNYLISTDDGHRLPDAEQTVLATDLADSSTEVGAALSAMIAANSPISGETGKKYKMVAGVIRNDGAPAYWYALNGAIDGSGHTPMNVGPVTTSPTDITIDYTAIGAAKVVSFVITPDETFASAGFTAGASVGLTSAVIRITKTTPFADYVYYDVPTDTFKSKNGILTPGIFGYTVLGFTSPGYLALTHPILQTTDMWDFSISGRGVTVPHTQGGSESGVNVQFRDWSGTLLTTPNADMKAFVSHGATGYLDPTTVTTADYPGSNFWFMGVFEVA